MAVISRDKFNSLVKHREPWCISIYMPCHVAGPEMRQDPIRFKNMLARAEEQLTKAGLRNTEAKQKMAGLYPLIEDSDFWRHKGQGLVIFLHENNRDVFRVPLDFTELVVVGDKPHLKPLLPLVARDVRFYILALSQNTARFFEATEFDFENVQVGGMPANMNEAMKYTDATRSIQSHTRMRMPGGGASDALFSGQGNDEVNEKTRKMRMAEYARLVDHAVSDWLGEDTAPMVLVASDPLIGVYREVNTYKHLHREALAGNPDQMDVRDIHSGSLALLKDEIEIGHRRAAMKYHTLVGTGHASSDVTLVIKAALNREVESLFVSLDEHRWGKFNREDFTIEFHDEQQPYDDDMLDLAATATLQNGGAVYPVHAADMPSRQPLAAVFRLGEEKLSGGS